jgi:tetratricopeptide (TPR) repeat protein
MPHRRMLFRFVLLTLVLATSAWAAPLDDAVALFTAKKYPEARQALQAIVTAEPQNARASYYLAQVIVRQGRGAQALTEALPWMEKAAKAAPGDPEILAAYGQLAIQIAAIHTSIPTALRGRDALDAALRLNPGDLAARETLYQFYRQAPWPIGNSSKAAAQLEEIRQRNPDRATVLVLNGQIAAKDYASAFRTCDALLAKNPDNYLALFHYGRTAALSGQNLERGLGCLQRFLVLAPAAPEAPRPAGAWSRIGNIYEKQGKPAAARAAYQTTLQLDPTNRVALTALAQLK